MAGVGDCTFHPTDAILKGKEGDACEPVCIFFMLASVWANVIAKITLNYTRWCTKYREWMELVQSGPKLRVLRNSASAWASSSVSRCSVKVKAK